MSGTGKKKKGKASAKAQGPADCSTLSSLPIPADVEKTPDALIKLAAKLSLTNGSFIDTKFFAYSRRNQSGVVYAPKAVYANSYMLRVKAPEYFEPLLRGGFDGSCVTGSLSGKLPDGFPDKTDDWDYESDSDIEDDDDDDGQVVHGSTSSWTNLSSTTSEERSSSEENGKKAEADAPASAQDSDDVDNDPTAATVGGPVGTIRLMSKFAYPTWNAFVYYLYTGDVGFSPLKSQTQTPKPSDAERRATLTASAPPCSPKSMYRLAEELGLGALKALAKKDIESKLSADNILSELFSSFTASHDEIREMELAFACTSAKQIVSKDIYEWMNNISGDELKRNVGVIACLIQKLAGPSGTTIPNNRTCNSCRRSNVSFNCSYCGNSQ